MFLTACCGKRCRIIGAEEKEYDLAVSFAGEQRDYVVVTVRACQAAGLKVFMTKIRITLGGEATLFRNSARGLQF